MILYKYRPGQTSKSKDRNKDALRRDIHSMKHNYFWASSFDQLNDPCEGLIDVRESKNLIDQIKKAYENTDSAGRVIELNDTWHNILNNMRKVGIFSLSKSYKDELLWAHYANSHKGFCIGYHKDMLTYYNLRTDDNLTEILAKFDVKYDKPTPPAVNLPFTTDRALENLINNKAGFKSERWKYEEEHRIVIDHWGKKLHHFQAIKEIYFGLKMPEEHRQMIMNRMQGRGITYYKMKLAEHSYDFVREQVIDPYGNALTYLCQINGKKPIKYQLVNVGCQFHKISLEFEIDSKITETQILREAKKLQKYAFWQSKSIFIGFKLKGSSTAHTWASISYYDDKWHKPTII